MKRPDWLKCKNCLWFDNDICFFGNRADGHCCGTDYCHNWTCKICGMSWCQDVTYYEYCHGDVVSKVMQRELTAHTCFLEGEP